MALDADVLAEIREWTGSAPDDAAVEVIYERKGTVTSTALAILRGRRADLLSGGPGAFNVQGDYSESDRYAGLAALEKLIGQLEQIDAAGGGVIGLGVTTVPLSRPELFR